MTSVTETSGTVRFTYDADGNVRSRTDQEGDTTRYTYDQAGDLLSATAPDGSATAYQYDARGNLIAATDPDGGTARYAYDDRGRLIAVTDADGKTVSFGYDDAGNLVKITDPAGAVMTLAYDAAGNLTAVTDPDGVSTAYAYDVLNRLAGPRRADAATYDQANELLGGPRYSYQYDRDGNLVGKSDSRVSWSYAYDYANRLVRVTRTDWKGTRVVSFKYDPFGRRIEKRVQGREGRDREAKVTTYVYDDEDVILTIRSGPEAGDDGGCRNREGRHRAGWHHHDNTTRYLHGPGIDEPLAVEQKGDVYFYHADGLGSITGLTDARGRVVQRYEYTSFGILRRRGDRVKQPYAFTGREWDTDTGLYFYRARYYDPVAGRFISRDPIGFAGGDVNLYGYVQNDPVNFVDPNGLILIQINRAIKAAFATSESRASFVVDTASAIIQKITNIPIPSVSSVVSTSVGIGLGSVAYILTNPSDSIVNEATEQYYLDQYTSYDQYNINLNTSSQGN